MPFFLVAYTSLIEASDEDAAACLTAEQIRDGRQVTLTVRADENTIRQVVVEATKGADLRVASPDDGAKDDLVRATGDTLETRPVSPPSIRKLLIVLTSVGLSSFATGMMTAFLL